MEFRFAGRALPAEPGSSVAAALVAAGERICRQSPDGGRGVFCGMGVCAECTVVVDGRPGVLACMTPVADGMIVDAQPVRPEVGSVVPPAPTHTELSPDVLVVGAGPAGLACARTAAAAGLDVVVIDERRGPGGQYYKQPSDPRPGRRLDAQFRDGRRLIDQALASGARLHTGMTVWGAFAPDHVVAVGSELSLTVRARRLVLGTGAYERGVPMPGWTLPGVMTTGAAQTLLRSYGTPAGRRVLVTGNGPLNLQVAAELALAGVQVVGVAEVADPFGWRSAPALAQMAAAAPGLARDGARYLAVLRRHRVPVHARTAVIRCDGDTVLRTATLARLDAAGHPVAGTERTLEVDAVCTGFGFAPSTEISRALGCEHRYDPGRDVLEVVRDDAGLTSLPTVRVIGDGGASQGAKVALAQGELAGAALVAELRGGAGQGSGSAARRRLRRNLRFQRALSRAYAAPHLALQLADDDTVVCRCEDVTLADARADAGLLSSGAIKRVTRAGMGPCQGRYCGATLQAIARDNSGVAVDAFSGLRPQAPIKPVRIGQIADRDEGER